MPGRRNEKASGSARAGAAGDSRSPAATLAQAAAAPASADTLLPPRAPPRPVPARAVRHGPDGAGVARGGAATMPLEAELALLLPLKAVLLRVTIRGREQQDRPG